MMAPALARIPAPKRAPMRGLAALLAGAALVVSAPAPAFAQEEMSEARLRKIEAEVRALQRKVFPGGDGRFFEPQIQPGDTGAARAAGSAAPASTTAVTDMLQRLDALEGQLQRLTSLSEENSNAIAQLSTRVAAIEADARARAAATDTPALPVAEPDAGEDDAADDRAMASNLAAMGAAGSAPSSSSASTTTARPAGPSPQRVAAVQAIAKPQTDDAGDDEYSYGFRLWDAGFYPEARQQLASFVERYPDHWRASYGRNLLGRAYLDEGKAKEAAQWFVKNYQADRTAARAPDSLLYLGESMIALGDTRRACIALAEFGETYPVAATGRLAKEYAANLARVECPAGS